MNPSDDKNGHAGIREMYTLLLDVHKNVNDLRGEMRDADTKVREELVKQAAVVRAELTEHYEQDAQKFQEVFIYMGKMKLLGTIGLTLLGLLGIGIKIVN